MNRLSTFLFAEPSFVEGVGRLVDVSGSFNEYNASMSPEEADFLAIYADWLAVGDDLNKCIEQVSEREGAGLGFVQTSKEKT